MQLSLRWQDEERFELDAGEHRLLVDGGAQLGLTPMQHLAAAVAGCMSIDLTHILRRMRTPPASLEVTVEADRQTSDSRRFTDIHLRFRIGGNVPRKNVDRALQLSRDTYCSAWQSMRPEIRLHTDVEIAGKAQDVP